MADVRSNTAVLEFDNLTKKQQRFVRKLTWEKLKAEAQFIVVIHWVTGCLGAMIGFFAGAFLCRLAFPDHLFHCFVVCAVIGAGIGAWIGRMWLERECQSHFRNAIRGNEDRISRIV